MYLMKSTPKSQLPYHSIGSLSPIASFISNCYIKHCSLSHSTCGGTTTSSTLRAAGALLLHIWKLSCEIGCHDLCPNVLDDVPSSIVHILWVIQWFQHPHSIVQIFLSLIGQFIFRMKAWRSFGGLSLMVGSLVETAPETDPVAAPITMIAVLLKRNCALAAVVVWLTLADKWVAQNAPVTDDSPIKVTITRFLPQRPAVVLLPSNCQPKRHLQRWPPL